MRVLLRLWLAGVVAVLLASVTPVRAGPAISFDPVVGTQLANPPFTLGWQFTVNGPILVTAVGVYDSPLANGLLNPHDAGIFDSTGALVPGTFVTVPSGTGAPLISQFRYVDISPVLLGPGTYQIGALFVVADPNDDGVIFPTSGLSGFATDPLISFVESTFASGAVLTNPLAPGGGATDFGYFGPNFILTAAIPEPATIALLGAVLLGFAAQRRRRRA